MPVPPPIIGGEQVVQRREKVVVATGTGLEDGHAGSGVRDEDMEQPTVDALDEASAVGRDVHNCLAISGVDLDRLRTHVRQSATRRTPA